MKKQFFYLCIIAAAICCLCGCTEASADSQSEKRALEDSGESKSNTPEETEATTLTPLETFARITQFSKESPMQTDKQENSSKNIVTTSTESDWFSENKLFDLEMHDEESSEAVRTWYRFPEDLKTTYTTVINQENPAETEK